MCPQSSAMITLKSISPTDVAVGWTGIVELHGSGFDEDSVAMFDGAVPPTKVLSSSLLAATVDSKITGAAGTKTVKVHSGAGELSNSMAFHVRVPQSVDTKHS